MGNSNSGRYGGKQKCEQSLAIDVRLMVRKGLLKNGTQFSWTWSDNRNIGLRVEGQKLILQYAYDGGASCTYPVYLVQTPCQYGGQRAWFSCPHCHQRKAKLFMKRGRFACHTCHRLRYHSQSLDPMARNQWAYSRLQNRLVDGELKPKGMHWKTFERLHERLEWIDQKVDAAFSVTAMRLFAKIRNA